MSSRLTPPKAGAIRTLFQLRPPVFVQSKQIGTASAAAGELLEEQRLALHHRQSRDRSDVSRPSTAVPSVTTRTVLAFQV